MADLAVRRAAALLALAAGLAAATSAAAQDPSSLCRFMVVRDGDQASGGEDRCSVRFQSGGLDAIAHLNAYPGQACAFLDDKRRYHPARHPLDSYEEIETAPDGRGYLRRAPRWFEETGPNQTSIYPGNVEIAYCREPYLLWTTVSIYEYGAEVVPEPVLEDLRARIWETIERLGGAAARTDADAEGDLVAALGPEVRAALEDLARRGLLETDDAIDLVSERARDPQVRATGRRLSEALRGRPLAVLTDTERTAVTTLAGMALLASVMDRNGEPAFPAAAANLGVLTELGVRAATDPDPARAHQAATAMARYAAMLRDIDVKALEDRLGAGGGETRS